MDLSKMQDSSAQAASVLKLLANQQRLLLLCALINREHTVSELEDLTGLSQSSMSQHLARLREENIVSTRREAQRIFYAVSDKNVIKILQTMHALYCTED